MIGDESMKDQSGKEKRFLSPTDAAIFLSLSKPSLDRLVSRREIPSYKIGGRRLFDREELVEWVKAHRDGAQAKPKRAETRKNPNRKGGKDKSTPQDLPPKGRKNTKNDLHYSSASCKRIQEEKKHHGR